MSAIEDFRVHLSWRTHPKRAKLQRRLGRDGVLAITDLWGWCAANPQHRDGNLRGMTAEDIAIAADYAGDIDGFVATLVDIKLLDFDADGYSVHDYLDWNPWVGGSIGRTNSARMNAFMRHHNDGKHAGRTVSDCPLCDSHANRSAAAVRNDAPAQSAGADGANGSAPTPTPSPTPTTTPLPTPSPPHGGGLVTREEFVTALANGGVTTQPTKNAYDTLREICPTHDELRSAIEQVPKRGWPSVQDRGAYVLGTVKRMREELPHRNGHDPTRGGRIGYHPGSTDHVEGRFDFGT